MYKQAALALLLVASLTSRASANCAGAYEFLQSRHIKSLVEVAQRDEPKTAGMAANILGSVFYNARKLVEKDWQKDCIHKVYVGLADRVKSPAALLQLNAGYTAGHLTPYSDEIVQRVFETGNSETIVAQAANKLSKDVASREPFSERDPLDLSDLKPGGDTTAPYPGVSPDTSSRSESDALAPSLDGGSLQPDISDSLTGELSKNSEDLAELSDDLLDPGGATDSDQLPNDLKALLSGTWRFVKWSTTSGASQSGSGTFEFGSDGKLTTTPRQGLQHHGAWSLSGKWLTVRERVKGKYRITEFELLKYDDQTRELTLKNLSHGIFKGTVWTLSKF